MNDELAFYNSARKMIWVLLLMAVFAGACIFFAWDLWVEPGMVITDPTDRGAGPRWSFTGGALFFSLMTLIPVYVLLRRGKIPLAIATPHGVTLPGPQALRVPWHAIASIENVVYAEVANNTLSKVVLMPTEKGRATFLDIREQQNVGAFKAIGGHWQNNLIFPDTCLLLEFTNAVGGADAATQRLVEYGRAHGLRFE